MLNKAIEAGTAVLNVVCTVARATDKACLLVEKEVDLLATYQETRMAQARSEYSDEIAKLGLTL